MIDKIDFNVDPTDAIDIASKIFESDVGREYLHKRASTLLDIDHNAYRRGSINPLLFDSLQLNKYFVPKFIASFVMESGPEFWKKTANVNVGDSFDDSVKHIFKSLTNEKSDAFIDLSEQIKNVIQDQATSRFKMPSSPDEVMKSLGTLIKDTKFEDEALGRASIIYGRPTDKQLTEHLDQYNLPAKEYHKWYMEYTESRRSVKGLGTSIQMDPSVLHYRTKEVVRSFDLGTQGMDLDGIKQHELSHVLSSFRDTGRDYTTAYGIALEEMSAEGFTILNKSIAKDYSLRLRLAAMKGRRFFESDTRFKDYLDGKPGNITRNELPSIDDVISNIDDIVGYAELGGLVERGTYSGIRTVDTPLNQLKQAEDKIFARNEFNKLMNQAEKPIINVPDVGIATTDIELPKAAFRANNTASREAINVTNKTASNLVSSKGSKRIVSKGFDILSKVL